MVSITAEAHMCKLEAELRQVTDERGVAWSYKTGEEIQKGREHLAHRYDGNFHDDCPYCLFARSHEKTTGMPEIDYYLNKIRDLEAEVADFKAAQESDA